MKFDTVKSFILIILVSLSLLLTFGLWTYQPSVDTANPANYEEQVDLGGETETLRDIIEPYNFIFHRNGVTYGFTEPRDRNALYHNMQDWVLYNFRFGPSNGPPVRDYYVGITLPEALSMQSLATLFTFSDEVNLPQWNFKQLYIIFDRNESTLKFYFMSESGTQQATATVNNSSKFDKLWGYMTTLDGLSEYMKVNFIDQPVYIPRFDVEVRSEKMTIRRINASLLVDVLFPNPEIVSRNSLGLHEIYYTDDQRGMRVIQDPPSIEYEHPSQQNSELNQILSPLELVNLSLLNINEHQGWTDEYNLMEVVPQINLVRYQMYYNDYPVYGGTIPSIIEQQWLALDQTRELTMYSRPLFSLNSPIDWDPVTIKSGEEVISYLENSQYNLNAIRNIRIGYKIGFWEESSDGANIAAEIYTLKPTWFMNYDGHWMEIPFDDPQMLKGAG